MQLSRKGAAFLPKKVRSEEVVRDQRPSKAWCCRFAKDISQPSDKILAIRIILKYLSTLDSTADDMVQSARDVDTGLSGHCSFVAQVDTRRKL